MKGTEKKKNNKQVFFFPQETHKLYRKIKVNIVY